MNTSLRLIILLPALLLCTVIALIALGFAGLSIPAIALAMAVVAVPLALVCWTFTDHRKRRQRSEFVDAQD